MNDEVRRRQRHLKRLARSFSFPNFSPLYTFTSCFSSFSISCFFFSCSVGGVESFVMPEGQGKSESAKASQVRDVKAALKRIGGHSGVEGYVVVDPQKGRILEVSGFNGDASIAQKYAKGFSQLVALCESLIRTIDNDNTVTFFRVAALDREILVAPDINKAYVLLVVQHVAAQ